MAWSGFDHYDEPCPVMAWIGFDALVIFTLLQSMSTLLDRHTVENITSYNMLLRIKKNKSMIINCSVLMPIKLTSDGSE